MDSLAKKDNIKAVRKALLNLPQELHGIYNEAMNRIRTQAPEKVERANQVLSWISYALRPLTVTEIRHALAVEPGDVKFDEEALPDEDLLVSVCAGLVTIDQESNIIRLVHYTTQEYFEHVRMAQFPRAQISIAVTCLTYVSFNVFAEGCCNSDQEIEVRLREYPLLGYAAQHWGDHARGPPEEEIKELAVKFLEHNSKLMCSNQVMHLSEYRYSGYSQLFSNDVTGLQIATSFGLKEIVRLLLEAKADVNVRDNDGRTALYIAASNGHEAVVKLLLEAKADANVGDRYGVTPLYIAASNGHEAIVKLLLEAKADANVRDRYGGTALYCAASNGHEEVVKLLLEAKADVNVRDRYGKTTLYCAASNGHEAVVKLLQVGSE
jgi:hypothetical protein